MFWNKDNFREILRKFELTVNMKCFEIGGIQWENLKGYILTVNMKCFEMLFL